MAKRGRKPHEPTSLQRELVQLHVTVGTRQEVIADILDIDPKTLRKCYRKELDQSKAKANAKVGGSLYNKAIGGDTSAMIFWMKTQAGWRETTVIGGDPENPIKTEEVGSGAAKVLAIVNAIAERSGTTGGTAD